MKTVITILCVAFIAMGGCKDNEPIITETYELSEEMMAYFVDYEVGTKWIYQDTLDANNYDTIELVSKENFDVFDGDMHKGGEGTLQKGFELYYKPVKSKDFKVRVTPGVNNTYYVKFDPMVTAAGAVIFENDNGIWTTGVTYYDSIEIKGNKYYAVIKSESNGGGYYRVHVSKNVGLVFYTYRNYSGGIAKGGDFKLIKTEKL